MHRVKLMAAAITLSVACLPATASADVGRIERRIPAQDLDTALKIFSRARGVLLQYSAALVKDLKTPGAQGNLSAEEELGALLAGTGLTYRFTGEKVAMIVPMESAPLGGGAGDAGDGADTNPPQPKVLNEVIVTAEKRSEPLQDVPVPVTVLQADQLLEDNELRLQDYYSQVPGLQYSTSPNTGGSPFIAIRGIVAGSGLTPTVGPTIDGVSFGSSTGFGGGYIVPDFDPSDLARIEVLKGPQGTLYGADSMGGLLQYVTVDPSLARVSGQLQAGGSYVENGAQPGFNTRGAINVPLSDTVAVRASAFVRQDPGYVNDPKYDLDGVNKLDSAGGHIAVLYQPSDAFSAKLSAIFQHDELYGAPYVDSPDPTPGIAITTPVSPITTDALSALQQDRLPDSGRQDRTLQAYILTLDGKLNPFGHPVDLKSISSYSRNRLFLSPDLSLTGQGLPSPIPAFVGLPGGGLISDLTTETDKYSEELRLSTALGPDVDWLLGTYFTHENSGYADGPEDGIYAVKPGAAPVFVLGGAIYTGYKEYAAFTDFTFKVTDRLDVQVGGRASRSEERLLDTNTGPLSQLFGFPAVQQGESSDTAYTYLFTPRYRLVEDSSREVMVYARLASGFRPGGVNVVTDPNAQLLPASFGPDKTYNYDLGIKADVLDHTLLVDLSTFYIDWRDIQLSAEGALDSNTGLGNSGYINGGRARSDGVELSTEWRPWTGLTLSASAAYDDAVLTQSLPPLAQALAGNPGPGTRLPLTARFTGNLGAQYEAPLSDGTSGFAGAQYSYVGGREGLFPSTGERQLYGAYGDLNAQAGVKWSTWTAQIYGTNLTDRRGVLGGGLTESPPYSFIYITPRTVGFEISEAF